MLGHTQKSKRRLYLEEKRRHGGGERDSAGPDSLKHLVLIELYPLDLFVCDLD